jgi:putative permease
MSTPQMSRQRVLARQSRIRLVAFLGVILSLGIIIFVVENLLVSCLLAFVISYLFDPLINYLERKNIDRMIATVGLFVAGGLLTTLAVVVVSPLLADRLHTLQTDSPKYIEGISRLIEGAESKLRILDDTGLKLDVAKRIKDRLLPATEQFFSSLPDLVRKFITVMLLAPFFAFFMLKDGRNFSRGLLSLVPNNIFELTFNIYSQINQQMGQFVRARLLESFIVGLVTWIGLTIISFPFAEFLAIFAAVTNLIPYIGPIIGTIPAVMVALINGGSPLDISVLLLIYFIAQAIDAALVIPLVVAKIVDLHPVTVIVVIIIGAQLMGVIGMIISIPVASALKVTTGTIFRYLTDYRV